LAAGVTLVVDCDEASLWGASGRLGIGQSSPVEVLLYLAAAPLLHQGELTNWPGVTPEALLAEVWAPRARDPRNRDSGQTWLAKNIGRLQEEVARAIGGLATDLVVKQVSGLRLNQKTILSDVEAFMAALEQARGMRGPAQVAAAEQAVALRVPGLLSRVAVKRSVGPKVEFYRWLGEPHWERAARRLEALANDASMLLARVYRDAGRHEEAVVLYSELMGDLPLDRRVHEGLLVAAASTGDIAQLHHAWEQVCTCQGGEPDTEVRTLHERLVRETERSGVRIGSVRQ